MSCITSSSNDSDSDSSNAEENYRLKEAAVDVVPNMLTFEAARQSSNIHAQQHGTLPPSLRTTSVEVNEDPHDLNTTPEFRAHVAKKLTQILDKSVDVIQTVGVSLGRTSESEQSCSKSSESESPGVKLFATSNQTVAAVFASEIPAKRKLKRPPSSSDSNSDEEMAKFASAAVSGKDILKQAKETPMWMNKVGSDRTETTGNKIDEKELARNPVGNVNGHSNETGTFHAGVEINVKKKKKRKKKLKGGSETQSACRGLERDTVRLIGNESVADKDTKKMKTKCEFADDSGSCSETADSLKVGVLVGEDDSHKFGAKKKLTLDVERSESAACHKNMYGKKKKCKHRHSEKM
ncbi:protein CUSTOS-like [Lineus longissimus]|uniref:protein CUSTOS-like n=1 Tax=Lineus longissimus TaxID=88925 RepID=UPI002B4CFF0E